MTSQQPTITTEWKSTKPTLCNAGMDRKKPGFIPADYLHPAKGLLHKASHHTQV